MRIKHSYKPLALYFLVMLTGATLFPFEAHSTFISPPRVVIDSNEVAGQMTILNRSNETKIYNFHWADRAMRPDGTIATDDELKDITAYRPASSVLVYSPRQVILAPGENQSIRFFVKRNQMTEGEYRSHIIIGATSAKKEEKNKVSQGLGGEIGVVAQAGIPVMVRHGKTVVDIEPQLFELIKKDGEDYLHAKFINKSTRTLYAKPTLICERPGLDEPEKIDVMAIRMYYEAIYIDQELPVRKKDPDLEGCTSIRVEFTDNLDFEYRFNPFYSQVLK